jgi:hypothetical protein
MGRSKVSNFLHRTLGEGWEVLTLVTVKNMNRRVL